MIIVETVVVGLLVSLACGGRLHNLSKEHLRGEWAFVLLLPLQLAWPYMAGKFGIPSAAAVVVWLIMMSVLGLVMLINARRRAALSIAALGIAANILVIGLNGGMPVSVKSASEIGGSRLAVREALAADGLHVELGDGTRLRLMADIIALPGPRWHRAVISIGDALLAVGLAGWVFAAAKQGPGRT